MTTPVPVLDVSGLTHARRDGRGQFRLALPRFRIFPGERVALIGPSGSGKTTALDVLALLSPPEHVDSFRVIAGDGAGVVDLAGIPPRRYADRLAAHRMALIGYVPQRGGLLPFLTARQNILAGPETVLCPPDTARLDALCDRLGIGDLLDRRPEALSVGEQQRVVICRALLKQPRLVIADEPTSALDPENADTMLTLFTEMAREACAAFLIATHDAARAERHGFVACRRGRWESGEGDPLPMFRHDGHPAIGVAAPRMQDGVCA